jgi:hypothetical protein
MRKETIEVGGKYYCPIADTDDLEYLAALGWNIQTIIMPDGTNKVVLELDVDRTSKKINNN